MRQKLGQHFLKNAAVSQAMAEVLELRAGDTVIEVGPGHGELTQALVGAAKIIAIEMDPQLAKGLRRRFAEGTAFEVIEGDVLEKLVPLVAQLPPGPYKLAGNLPYYLTGHLLRIVSELDRKPERAVFMVQKEVAERMSSAPPDMNRLAAAVQFWAEPRIVKSVKRTEFDPPPEVDSAVVLLRSKPPVSPEKGEMFYATVRALFAQPRKTVLNNLKEALPAGRQAAEKAKAALEACGIDPGRRPQDLDIAQIERIGQRVREIS